MKRFLLTILLVSTIIVAYAQTSYITIWETSNTPGTYSGASDLTIKLPVAGGTYEGSWFKVGEPATSGTFTNATLTDNIINVPTAGEYEVTISTVGAGFYWQIGATFVNTDCKKLTEVKQWGNLWTWGGLADMFRGCIYMQVTASDAPTLAGTLNGMFRDCTEFTGNASFNSWNVSNVNDMQEMFRLTAFNQSLSSWDVSSVTNMNNMFSNSAFNNTSIGSWTFRAAGVTLAGFLFKNASVVGGTGMDCITFSNILKGWSQNASTPMGLTLGAAGQKHGDQTSFNFLDIDKSWTINGTTYDATCAQVLPVTFSGLNASILNGDLLVKWKTLSEKNNDHFIIYMSKDGRNWEEAGKVSSKAENGNSDGVLEYMHIIKNNAMQLAGFPVVISLFFALLLIGRKKQSVVAATLLVGVFFMGCNKIDWPMKKNAGSDVIYVKIAQIDKNGETSSDSDVVVVKKSK